MCGFGGCFLCGPYQQGGVHSCRCGECRLSEMVSPPCWCITRMLADLLVGSAACCAPRAVQQAVLGLRGSCPLTQPLGLIVAVLLEPCKPSCDNHIIRGV